MSEELREKLNNLLFVHEIGCDTWSHASCSCKGDESILDQLEALIKQERIRYGEWLIGKDEDEEYTAGKSTWHDIKIKNGTIPRRNILRAELRQRNKGEMEDRKDTGF